jgi:hypothetical protein
LSDALSALDKSRKDVNTPTTVPNSPTKGAADAVVARNVRRFSRAVSSELAARCITRCKALMFGFFFAAIMAPALRTGPMA